MAILKEQLDWDKVGQRCLQVRQALKRSQKWVGAQAGIHYNSVQNLEYGSPMLSANLNRVIAALGANPEWIRYGRGPIYLDGPQRTLSGFREAMEALEWTPAELARQLPKRLGATEAQVGKWMAGTEPIPTEASLEMAYLLGLQPPPMIYSMPEAAEGFSSQAVRECATLLAELMAETGRSLAPEAMGEVMVRLCEAHRELEGKIAPLRSVAMALWR